MILSAFSFLSRTALTLAMLGSTAAAQGPAIAAASDLNAALPEIASLFTKQTGHVVRLAFGSSGSLTQQILNGAPFEMFLSADEAYVARLSAAGMTEGPGVLYATGRIGLFVPRSSKLKADAQLQGLADQLKSGTLGKFAIANPEHAPYGRAAREALVHAQLWTTIQRNLVLGENVSQAAQFAMSGSADGGIIPLSAAMTEAVRSAGTFVLIPDDWHQPLRQRAVLVKRAGSIARSFHEFLQSPRAVAVLRRYGFAVHARD